MDNREQVLRDALSKNAKEVEQWEAYKVENATAIANMATFSKRLTVDVLVPVGKRAFVLGGQLVHTNEILVGHYQDYFSNCSAHKATELCNYRISIADKHLEKLRAEMIMWENKITTPYSQGVLSTGEQQEIIEKYDEAAEAQWRLAHKESVRKHKQQESRDWEKLSDEDIFKYLDEAMLMEELMGDELEEVPDMSDIFLDDSEAELNMHELKTEGEKIEVNGKPKNENVKATVTTDPLEMEHGGRKISFSNIDKQIEFCHKEPVMHLLSNPSVDDRISPEKVSDNDKRSSCSNLIFTHKIIVKHSNATDQTYTTNSTSDGNVNNIIPNKPSDFYAMCCDGQCSYASNQEEQSANPENKCKSYENLVLKSILRSADVISTEQQQKQSFKNNKTNNNARKRNKKKQVVSDVNDYISAYAMVMSEITERPCVETEAMATTLKQTTNPSSKKPISRFKQMRTTESRT